MAAPIGFTRMQKLAALAAALALTAFASASRAQTAAAYPDKSVRLVVPFAAGGALDVVARIVGQKLTETWGRQIVIDNRLGAGGNIGAEYVSKAPADGYTLLMSSVTTQAINMSLLAKPPYDFVRDYAPVALVASAPLALVIHASLPAKSVRKFIALAKAHPGELNYFSSGTGTGTHLAAVIFDQLAGVRTTHVPYKGGAQGLGDLLSGQVQFAMSTIGLVEPHVQTGRLRLLGVGSVKRYTRLPDIPTIAESGVRGYEAEQWYGVVGPAGTPAAIVNKLAAEIKTIIANPDVRERFYSQGIEPVYATPEEFAVYIKASVAKYAKVIKTLGLKVE
ncbi:MAG TPA: tripartite tricarboxylate transporter substrate binding protein [Burkholderiales bacterium]|nr:tripartite tricarboxylate transporter substrate binding protein [Burkholderiales bacterium]